MRDILPALQQNKQALFEKPGNRIEEGYGAGSLEAYQSRISVKFDSAKANTT